MQGRVVKMKRYFPRFYDGYVEIDAIIDTEDKAFEEIGVNFRRAINNQFIKLADETGISAYEVLFDVIADPSTETLEERRDRLLNRVSVIPYYTTIFLRNRLDSLIGAGLYNLIIDYDNYTLYLESAAKNQLYYNEIAVLMSNIKPCNIVFINMPLVSQQIFVSEQVNVSKLTYNYVLGGQWKLGEKPFVSYEDKGIIKGRSTNSMSSLMEAKYRQFTLSEITSVLINNTIRITTFLTKEEVNGEAIIEYIVPQQEQNIEVTNIKLLDKDGLICFESPVYVPVYEDTIMKHNIIIKEGVAS
jgi:hypothetical protein